jgi:hypothetical protein
LVEFLPIVLVTCTLLDIIVKGYLINTSLFSFQYVAYADGLIRAYNIHTYAVHYTLQSKMSDYFLLLM